MEDREKDAPEREKTWCKSTRGLKEKPKLKEKFLVKVFTEGEKVV